MPGGDAGGGGDGPRRDEPGPEAGDGSSRSESATGPLDVSTLEVIGQRAASHPLVSSRTFQPDRISPRYLEVELDESQYPPPVTDVRLDVRWFVGGDYTVHYVEAGADGRWQCRWDRHPKPDAPREHFHPPPDASASVGPSPLDADHHLEVLFAVQERVETRVRERHE